MNKEKSYRFIMIVAVFLFVLGLFVSITSTMNYYQYNTAIDNGEVVGITVYIDSIEKETRRSSGKTRYEYTYIFDYEVNNVIYEGSKSDTRSTIPLSHPEIFKIFYDVEDPGEYFFVEDAQPSVFLYWLIPLGSAIGFFVTRYLKNSYYY